MPVSNTQPIKNVTVYFDGFNVYHAIDSLNKPYLKWMNYRKLAESFLRADERLHKAYLFTSLTNMSAEKRRRNQLLLDASRAVGVEIIQANFKTSKKYCKSEDKWCKFKEEKGNDVAIAVRMLADAHAGATHRIILVTADADQIPSIAYIKDRFPEIELSLFLPPGRKNQGRDLGKLFSAPTEITEGRVNGCLLPEQLTAANGDVIVMPPEYNRPPT